MRADCDEVQCTCGYRLPLMSTMGSLVDSEYERHETSTIPTEVQVAPPPPYGLLRSVIRKGNRMGELER